MIREGKQLPPDVQKRVPAVVEKIAQDPDVLALYAFGSLSAGKLKPLSDLEFGILLSDEIDRQKDSTSISTSSAVSTTPSAPMKWTC
jgi:hypothetical protein